LQDAEKVVSSFYNYCSLAGPLRCGFHTGTTADDVSTRLSTLMARLRRQPLTVPDAPTGPEIVTYSDVKTMFFTALYKPLTSFPKIAKILADIEAGDGKSFIDYQKKQFSCNCGDGGPERPPGPDFDAIWAIACSDGEQVDDSLDEMYEYLHMLQDQSPTSGGSWAVVRMGCAGWKIRPQGLVYNGPISGNTSWPLLFLGNSADPVTPVRNAHKMAKAFEGSVVLEQNSEGVRFPYYPYFYCSLPVTNRVCSIVQSQRPPCVMSNISVTTLLMESFHRRVRSARLMSGPFLTVKRLSEPCRRRTAFFSTQSLSLGRDGVLPPIS
jgi:hypothetical protein